ncbi:MAG: hypothetical protein RLZZ458_178 [Planctomycetota bacterium]
MLRNPGVGAGRGDAVVTAAITWRREIGQGSNRTFSAAHVHWIVIPHLRVTDCLALQDTLGIIEP